MTLLRQANLINAEWVKAASGNTIAVDNPADGQNIGLVPRLSGAEVTSAVDAAHAAFTHFSRTTAAERAVLLGRLAELIRMHQEELAQLLTREQGKPLREARAEIAQSAAYIQWFAEEARRVYGQIVPSPWANRRIQVTKHPVGIAALITPWNFPASMLARKLGPALAAGCTVVAKPASQTPFSALALGELALQAGFPAGTVNIVTGDARMVGEVLMSDPRVRKVSFTGSTEVGKALVRQSAATLKKTSMELGGNAPFLVFADADIERAVQGVIDSKFRNAGQTCVCTNRIYVEDDIYDDFSRRLSEAVAALKVGNGFADDTEIGPLIDDRAVATTQDFVDDAVAKGGQVLVGGAAHTLGSAFFAPTVIGNANASMRLAREEIFGPVAPLFRFKTEEEAIALANDTEFGLACYVYTRDLGRAFRLSESLEYGIVGVNEGLVTTEVAPFGGYKESGHGREGGSQGIEDYLEVKYTCFGGI
jgi:succinate-semialdehyde dehydrogenase/glutarate-semialdehyde dehydrogenase